MIKAVKYPLLKSVSAILIYALLLPFALKLNHVFDNHQHIICKSKIENHIHESELDCDFYNYKINQVNFFISTTFDEDLPKLFIPKNYALQDVYYQTERFVSFLRGPPCFV